MLAADPKTESAKAASSKDQEANTKRRMPEAGSRKKPLTAYSEIFCV
jgi:hypothetical protein